MRFGPSWATCFGPSCAICRTILCHLGLSVLDHLVPVKRKLGLPLQRRQSPRRAQDSGVSYKAKLIFRDRSVALCPLTFVGFAGADNTDVLATTEVD